eukprot:SAG31_NODE_460_length_15364_cov_11.851294_10_plen_137_part_00
MFFGICVDQQQRVMYLGNSATLSHAIELLGCGRASRVGRFDLKIPLLPLYLFECLACLFTITRAAANNQVYGVLCSCEAGLYVLEARSDVIVCRPTSVSGVEPQQMRMVNAIRALHRASHLLGLHLAYGSRIVPCH